MKNFLKIIVLFLLPIAFLLSGCSHTIEDTDVISIGYHSDDCQDCNILMKKMKKMNVKYSSDPIVFIKYDKTSSSTLKEANEEVQKWGMLDTAKKDDGLKYVILYNALTKERIAKINYDDSEESIAAKIDEALKQSERR